MVDKPRLSSLASSEHGTLPLTSLKSLRVMSAERGRVPGIVGQRSRLRVHLALASACALGVPLSAPRAQSLVNLFPPGFAGYDQEPGVTVLSRLRPEYEPQGVRVGSFIVRPRLDEATGYNSFVNPVSGAGSWNLQTAASVSAQSDWGINALGGTVSVTNNRFFSLPDQNFTDWTASVQGSYANGHDEINLSYAHTTFHQLGTEVGAVFSATPVPVDSDVAVGSYTFDFGRLRVTPSATVADYRFSNATINSAVVNGLIVNGPTSNGVTADQSYLDHLDLSGSVTARYALGERRDLVVVAGVSRSHFVHPVSGAPSFDSTSGSILAGIDYEVTGLWQVQLLVGTEVRGFAASQFGTAVSGIVEGNAIWTPTGLTTITGTVSRTLGAPASVGNAGYTFSRAALTIDHEYFRNLILHARAGFQSAQALQGGTSQVSVTGVVGATQLLTRRISASAEFDYTRVTGTALTTLGTPAVGARAGNGYTQEVFTLGLHLAL